MTLNDVERAGLDRTLDLLHAPCSMRQALEVYREIVGAGNPAVIAELGRQDRFFLLTHILRRPDLVHPWVYARCREVEAAPDGRLDLWAREHGKTSVITFGGIIQEILREPEITVGIFSHTRPNAKAFLRQIKLEFEQNALLKAYYPTVCYSDPSKESPKWSEDDGIIVRRVGNPKEATVEAWGLVDGQPTGKHFRLCVYDDVVTKESVSTADQITKTTRAWELSLNLGATDGKTAPRKWHVGTKYHFADTYADLEARGAVKVRKYPATANGQSDGEPVLWSRDILVQKVRDMGRITAAAQLFLDPLAAGQRILLLEWSQNRYEVRPETLKVYILVDPADSKNPGSSRTAMVVFGIDAAYNKYLLDGRCHRMNLTERWRTLRDLHRKWKRTVGIVSVKVGYEKYGMQADIQHMQAMMRIERYSFEMHEVSWTKDALPAKDDRIVRLVPDWENGKLFLPYRTDEKNLTAKQREMKRRGRSDLIAKPIKAVDEDHQLYDVVEDYLIPREYNLFPATTEKDFLDAMSRIYDLEPARPVRDTPRRPPPEPVY